MCRHVEWFLSGLESPAWQNENSKSMRLHCGLLFQVKPWEAQERVFFSHFLLNKEHKPHTHLMQNLTKLNYGFHGPQKGQRVPRGHSKALRHIFKDDASALTVALRNLWLSKAHQNCIPSISEYKETL